MLHISSRHNELYKQLRRLLQTRSTADRNTESSVVSVAAVLEGVHLCQDWLQHCGQPERAIFDSQRLQGSTELQALLAGLEEGRAVTMDAGLMGGLSAVAKGQGVLFLVQRSVPVLPDYITHTCVWLDRIQDPGNVGTLLRTAAAAGIKDVYLSKECASAWSPRVLRSAQGAHFALTLYENVDLQQIRKRLRMPLYTTALTKDAVSLYESTLSTPCAWVFGNEGQGVAPDLLQAAQQRVYIPQDTAVESLNVAVAAGICLFEQRRRHLLGI